MRYAPQVHVVDDDFAMRKSTCMLLQAAGLTAIPYESAEAFLKGYQRGSPGCLILDLNMGGMSGMELLQNLRAGMFDLPVIILTGTGTVRQAVEGMKLAAHDFLEKPLDPGILVAKVKTALNANASRGAEVAEIEQLQQRFATLTARERLLLKHIVDGLPNKLIAVELDIAIKTVEHHRSKLMEKAGASNAADLVRMYMRLKDILASPLDR
jgi:two-component system response regulator FixJ